MLDRTATGTMDSGENTRNFRSMLSEKAKGKQRAVDPELDDEPSQTDSRNLTIRFTEGIPDLVLFVTSTDTVRDVKTKVRISSEIEAGL